MKRHQEVYKWTTNINQSRYDSQSTTISVPSRNRPIIPKDGRRSSRVSNRLDTVGPLNSTKHLYSSKESRLHKQCFVQIQNATEPSAKGKPSMSAWQTQSTERSGEEKRFKCSRVKHQSSQQCSHTYTH